MSKKEKKPNKTSTIRNTADLISYYSETWSALIAYDKKDKKRV